MVLTSWSGEERQADWKVPKGLDMRHLWPQGKPTKPLRPPRGPALFSLLSPGTTQGGGPTQEEACGTDGQGWTGDAELPSCPLFHQLTTPISWGFQRECLKLNHALIFVPEGLGSPPRWQSWSL